MKLRLKNIWGLFSNWILKKAYDKVNWDFLFRCIEIKNFSPLWVAWLRQVICNGTVSVKLNNQLGPYFVSHKGVRQGESLSPFLFNLAADCLTKMIHRAQQNGLITGLVPHLISNGVAILQYADDTILCLQHDLEKANNLKLLLYLFELMSGLKINFRKVRSLCWEGIVI